GRPASGDPPAAGRRPFRPSHTVLTAHSPGSARSRARRRFGPMLSEQVETTGSASYPGRSGLDRGHDGQPRTSPCGAGAGGVPMPLSEHEQRMLDEIERALYQDDPKFATSVNVTR